MAPAGKPENLGLIHSIHMVEGKNRLSKAVFLHPHVCMAYDTK